MITTIYWGIFFFQAEDGIRDKLVTGVQTCALPIWSFDEIYAARYGYSSPAEPVEIVTWKLSAIGGTPRISLAKAPTVSGNAKKGERLAYFPERRGFVETPIYDRYALA